jgi:hypothetical protein
MDTETIYSRPVKVTVFGFLALMGVAGAIAAAKTAGIIETTVERRALGLVIGVLVVLTGNLLPKTRPLSAAGGGRARAMAVERFAGWTLVLAGLSYVALFMFVPLDQARTISSIIGMSAIAVVAANWLWQLRSAASRGQKTMDDTDANAPVPSKAVADRRKLLFHLLFAFLWVFATACAMSLFSTKRWSGQLGWGMTQSFFIMYAALTAVLGSRRSDSACPSNRR